VGLNYPVNGALYTQDLLALQASGALGSNIAFENVAGYFPDPKSIQYFLGVERELPYGLAAKVHLIETRGLHLNFFETQNLANRATNVVPEPTFGTFFQFQAGDRSNFNGLETQLSKQMKHGVKLDASYTWSKVLSRGDADLLQPTEVQDNANPQNDYGPAPFDIRNRLVLDGIWRLPLNEWLHANGHIARALLGGWEFGGIFTGQSGLPINVTDSASIYPADRPNWASGPAYVSGYRSFAAGSLHQYLNPCQAPQPGITTIPTCPNAPQDANNPHYQIAPFGNAPVVNGGTGVGAKADLIPGTLQRYGVYAPGFEDLDLSMKKVFAFTDKFNFQLRADAFNSLNHTNLTGIVATVNSSNFGQLTAATQRTVQIGGRIEF
jgi:hypothetical protein